MGMRDRSRVNWFPKTVTLRPGCERDLVYVRDIDLKCSHYPWSNEGWELLEQPLFKLCIAVDKAQPIGFVVYWCNEGDVVIPRIGVKPTYQHGGIGTGLMDFVKNYAKEERCLRVTTTAAEIYCLPGHPDDVSQWLLGQGFRAEPPILKDVAFMYGQSVDGFRFVHALGEANERSA